MSYSTEVLADSPVFYWHVDETSGTAAADATGNGHAGTYGGSPTLGVAALINAGTAITLNGSNQGIGINGFAALNANGKVSLEAWIKMTNDSASPEMICADDSATPRYFQFRISAVTHTVEFILIDTSLVVHTCVGNKVVNDGLTHHVVGTYDGAAMKIYVDGLLDATLTVTFALATGSPALTVGRRLSVGSSTNWYPGTIDEIALYTSALTLARVQAHYTAGGGSLVTSAIKTVEGLAIASVKTVEGLTRSSAKTILGLA